MKARILAAGAIVSLTVATAGVAITHEVNNKPSPESVAEASKILRQAPTPRWTSDYKQQVSTVAAVQRAILDAAPVNRGIPQGRSRELPDLVREKKGLCFDRSRAIETVLRVAGYDVRHVSIYSRPGGKSAFGALATPGVPSHAVSEVKTSRGWMVVDSNIPWLGLTKDGAPVSLEQLSRIDQSVLAAAPYKIFQDEFTWVYGLYSRHGRFYPPYNVVPDVNWRELAHNL